MPQLIEAIPIWAIHCIISLAWQYNCVDCCSGWFGSRRKSSPLNSIRSKGVQEDLAILTTIADAVEAWPAVVAAALRLAIDDAGARAQLGMAGGASRRAKLLCRRSQKSWPWKSVNVPPRQKCHTNLMFEPCRCDDCDSHIRTNRPMAQVVLDRARVVAIIGERESDRTFRANGGQQNRSGHSG